MNRSLVHSHGIVLFGRPVAWHRFWRWLRAGLALPLVILLPAVAITGSDYLAGVIVLIAAVQMLLALIGGHR